MIENFTGLVIAPTDSDYAEAATSYHVLGSPVLVARASSTADAAAVVRYAASEGLTLSVRSGGHSTFGTNEGGVVLDLSGISEVDVLDGSRVRVGSGAVWGRVAEALAPHGLGLSSGDTYTVGVGGLTLGGGVGWLVRQYGLALDSLLEAEVVLASGDVVIANGTSEPDLFWAIRGGGGNVGVVTHFTFQAHPLDGVVFGTISFDPAGLADTLTAWREAMRVAPRELNATIISMPAMGPEMPETAQVVVCYGGTDRAAADAAIAPLLALPGVSSSEIAEVSYPEVLENMEVPEAPVTIVDHNTFARSFDRELVDVLVAAQEGMGAAVLMLRYVAGAFNEVPSEATAFAWRDAEVFIISAAFLPPDASEEDTTRIHDLWSTLAPFTEGMYTNFTIGARPELLGAMYPPRTLARLRSLKRRFDPGNLFSQNQNIVPG